jgi:ATP-dependent Clp protease protease subunit
MSKSEAMKAISDLKSSAGDPAGSGEGDPTERGQGDPAIPSVDAIVAAFQTFDISR